MIEPFVVEDLFEPNKKDFQVTYNKNYVCIDNYYKNYSDILKFFENMHAESWKSSRWSRNFIDYYDCRPYLNNTFPDKTKMDGRLKPLTKLITRIIGKTSLSIERNLSFNVFKHKIKDLPQTKQHHPHYDYDSVNILVYLDPYVNGGTALYKSKDVENNEHINLIVDVSDYEIEEIIPAKPNRCVLFSGNQLHGAWIEDNNIYYDNWRITQATIVRIADEHNTSR